MPLVWAILTVGVVAAVVWAGLQRLPERGTMAVAAADDPAPPSRPTSCVEGRDYYLLVKLVEFAPTKPGGRAWDRAVTSGSVAPDPKVKISWHGQQVYALPTREDQLIATWDLFRVNMADIALSGGNVDVASSINAPIIKAESGAPVTIDVYDADVTYDDLAMTAKLNLLDLHEGENAIPTPERSGVKRLVVQIIDRSTPLAELVAMAGKR